MLPGAARDSARRMGASLTPPSPHLPSKRLLLVRHFRIRAEAAATDVY